MRRAGFQAILGLARAEPKIFVKILEPVFQQPIEGE